MPASSTVDVDKMDNIGGALTFRFLNVVSRELLKMDPAYRANVILLADANASVGGIDPEDEEADDPYQCRGSLNGDISPPDARGEYLLSFCERQQLLIQNTFFPPPNGQSAHTHRPMAALPTDAAATVFTRVIDHVITRFAPHHGISVDFCGIDHKLDWQSLNTDHRSLQLTIRIPKAAAQRTLLGARHKENMGGGPPKPKRLDWECVKRSNHLRQQIKASIKKRRDKIDMSGLSAAAICAHHRDITMAVCEELVPEQTPQVFKSKEWFEDSKDKLLTLLAARKTAWIAHNANRGDPKLKESFELAKRTAEEACSSARTRHVMTIAGNLIQALGCEQHS